MLRAEKEGITPEALIARVLEEHKRDFAGFNVAFDNYSHHALGRDARALRRVLPAPAGRGPDRREAGRAVLRSGEGDVPARPLHQGRVPEVRREGPVRRLVRSLRLDLQPDRPQEPLLGGLRRASRCARRPTITSSSSPIRAARPSSSSGPRPDEHLQPEARNKIREWFEQGLNDWDISRDAPYFGFEIPGRARQVFLRLARRADRLFRQLQESCRRATGIDFDRFVKRRLATPSSSTSSARTSSTSTRSSGPRC